MNNDLASRVEALERQLDVLRSEMRSEIKAAAHDLRDSENFIRPFWQAGADHASGHLLGKASRWIAMIVVGALGVWVLLWAGSTGAFKGLLQ